MAQMIPNGNPMAPSPAMDPEEKRKRDEENEREEVNEYLDDYADYLKVVFDRVDVEGCDLLGVEIRVGTGHGTVSIPGTLYSPRTARTSVSTWVSRSPAPSRTTSAFSGAS